MLVHSAIALAVLLVSVSAQPPAECLNMPRVKPEECCPNITPPYISNGPQCGLPDPASGIPPSGPPSCDAIKCTMKDYMTGDKLDENKFLPAMKSFYGDDSRVQAAYQKCGPMENNGGPCPVFMVGSCFAMEMFRTCPDNGNADCATAKSLIDKCGPGRRN